MFKDKKLRSALEKESWLWSPRKELKKTSRRSHGVNKATKKRLKRQKSMVSKCKKYSVSNTQKYNKHEQLFIDGLLNAKIHFEYQKVLRKFIVDFYFPKRGLIVEIDGVYHNRTKEYDEYRQKELERWGWKVLRFTNSQVERDVNFCIEQVLHDEESDENFKSSMKKARYLNLEKK